MRHRSESLHQFVMDVAPNAIIIQDGLMMSCLVGMER